MKHTFQYDIAFIKEGHMKTQTGLKLKKGYEGDVLSPKLVGINAQKQNASFLELIST